jgi:transcriptional regulator with XRE-family HTH domain
VSNAEQLGRTLLEARQRNGYSRAQLAGRIEASERAIQYWEAGEKVPNGLVLLRLAYVLGIPCWELRRVGKWAGAAGT